MRVIPVIDLLNNQTVHAVKGDRDHYRPIQSVLCDSSNPLKIAEAFRNRLGLNEIYIADLDAIRNPAESNHRPIIENLACRLEFDVILDAGVSDIEGLTLWLESGVQKVIIGSETLTSFEALQEISEAADTNRIIFSLDCRNGNILSSCTELQQLTPIEALDRIQSIGLRQIILLDLDRVGSGSGINISFASGIRAAFPEATLLLGGGITSAEEIQQLQSLGIEGVLVATALHRGIIDSKQLSEIHRLG